MYKRIIRNKHLSLKKRIKGVLAYYLRRRGARIIWNKSYQERLKHLPDSLRPVDNEDEKAHILYWQPFRRKVNLATFRACTNASGLADPKILPEEVLMTDIEPSLNDEKASFVYTLKSFYNLWFKGNAFPQDLIHNIDGSWLDHNFHAISPNEVKSLARDLVYPLVMKPNRDTYGGKNVFFPKNSEELIELMEGRKDFIVQERIPQHSFFNQLNNHGYNTVRVNLYRSVVDNRLHYVNATLRTGVAGSLDNVSAGGLSSLIGKDGTLPGFAMDMHGKKHFEHPDTGSRLDMQIPDFEQCKKVSLQVAGEVFYSRIICLDLLYDSEGRWRAIEVNTYGTTLKFVQLHGVPFFEDFTDEVRDYCVKNHWTLRH